MNTATKNNTLNSKANRVRIVNTGKSVGSGNLPGADGRAYEDFILDGNVYRVTFPSWVQRGTVEIMDCNPADFE